VESIKVGSDLVLEVYAEEWFARLISRDQMADAENEPGMLIIDPGELSGLIVALAQARQITLARLVRDEEPVVDVRCMGYLELTRGGDVDEPDCVLCEQPCKQVWVAAMTDNMLFGPLCNVCASSE